MHERFESAEEWFAALKRFARDVTAAGEETASRQLRRRAVDYGSATETLLEGRSVLLDIAELWSRRASPDLQTRARHLAAEAERLLQIGSYCPWPRPKHNPDDFAKVGIYPYRLVFPHDA